MNDALNNLMQQAQQIQENMKKAQDELANVEATGQAGGGMVKVTLNGSYEAKKVDIDSSLVGDDKEMLEDLISAAITDASRKVAEVSKEKMMGAAAGLQLPPGMKFPF